ncbi:hypothetical protein [Pseudomonas palmensis]
MRDEQTDAATIADRINQQKLNLANNYSDSACGMSLDEYNQKLAALKLCSCRKMAQKKPALDGLKYASGQWPHTL